MCLDEKFDNVLWVKNTSDKCLKAKSKNVLYKNQ
jgi:hypothetical protein